MEEKLLELFSLANQLNDKQDIIYAEIKYTANDNQTLEIFIRTKEEHKYVEECKIQLKNKSIIGWDNIIALFKTFVGGATNE